MRDDEIDDSPESSLRETADESAEAFARADAEQDAAEREASEEADDADVDAPAVAAAPAVPPAAVSRPPIPQGWRLAVQLLLPVVLCGLAVGVHWWINVPNKLEVSPRDQGAGGKPKPTSRRRKPKQASARTSSDLSPEA